MDTVTFQITSLTIVVSNVYSGADQRKHQRSASLVFVWGIHREPLNSPHKWPVTRKCFHLMTSLCFRWQPLWFDTVMQADVTWHAWVKTGNSNVHHPHNNRYLTDNTKGRPADVFFYAACMWVVKFLEATKNIHVEAHQEKIDIH